MERERIAIGCDHAAIDMKNLVITALQEKGFSVSDMGTYTTDSCDYPDIAEAVAKKVVSGDCQKGIVVCGTGIGIGMAANKVNGIRCATCNDMFTAEMTRRHNDANMLAFGARVVGSEVALRIVDIFLSTAFEGGRHEKRVNKIMALEKSEN